MKFNSIIRLTVVLALTTTLFSCGSKKDIVYFQGLDTPSTSTPIKSYSPTIKPDDMLTINVSALDIDAVRPFNLATVSFTESDGTVGRAMQQSYLVDNNGNIEFPVLGSLKLAGLTRIQATELIKTQLKEYIVNPIVSIRNINFKVTILGEVNRPGSYTISNERITILEAIGLAGDLTIQAKRNNLLIVREDSKGKKKYHKVDLTSNEIFSSPVYYLRQNDLLYVQPNNSRVKSSTVGPNTNTALSIIGTLISAVTATAIIINITR